LTEPAASAEAWTAHLRSAADQLEAHQARCRALHDRLVRRAVARGQGDLHEDDRQELVDLDAMAGFAVQAQREAAAGLRPVRVSRQGWSLDALPTDPVALCAVPAGRNRPARSVLVQPGGPRAATGDELALVTRATSEAAERLEHALGAPRGCQRLGAGSPPPTGSSDVNAWKAYLLGTSKAEAQSYVQQQLGVNVDRYYHDGAIDYGMLAVDLARKQTGLPIADGCLIKPANLSGPELQAYALRCGQDAAAAYVKEQTGIDARKYIKDGKPDWAAVGGAVAKEYFGTSVDFHQMFNDDGSVNYRDITGQVAGIAAAAVCTAYGAGAAASVCGWLGSTVGKALYDVGEAFIEFLGFGSDDDQRASYIYNPTAEDAQRWAVQWWVINRPEYLRQIMAIRAVSVASLSAASMLIKAWEAALGEKLTLPQMLRMMTERGLALPAGWAGSIGLRALPPPIFGGPWKYGDQDTGHSLSILWDWQVAERAFGQKPSTSLWDRFSAVLDPFYVGEMRPVVMGFTSSSDPGGAALVYIFDADGGPKPEPWRTAPGQWATFGTPGSPGGYVPPDQAKSRNTSAMAGSSEPMDVSIFDPRAADWGAISAGCPESERGSYNAKTKTEIAPVSEACRKKIAQAWEAQFWFAPDKVQVAYNTQTRATATAIALTVKEGTANTLPAAWLSSLQKAINAVQRDIIAQKGARAAEAAKDAKDSTLVTVLKTTAKVAGVGAVALGAYRASQGMSVLPRSVRPATWLSK